MEGAEASPQSLPVDGQDPALVRRERRRSTQIGGAGPESRLDVGCIEPAQDRSDRRVRCWSLPTQAERLVETFQMHPDEGVDAAVGVRSSHDRENREQQDVPLLEAFALSATRIGDIISSRVRMGSNAVTTTTCSDLLQPSPLIQTDPRAEPQIRKPL